MEVVLASSAGVKVRVREYQDADIVALVQQGKVTELTTAINADRRQKVALVDFRSDLSDKITALGFARKTTTATKDGEAQEVPDETEGEHINRFIDALVAGSFTHPSITISSGDEKAKQNSAYDALQKIAFTCGDKKTDDGLPCYELDVNRPVRTGGGKVGLPKWALESADKIIANGSTANWASKFTAGFTSPRGIAIDPIAFDSFVQVAPEGSTADTIQATNERNRRNLAAALVAYDRQEKSKQSDEFV